MKWKMIEAGELMARRTGSVDPSKFIDERFELHSIPAFDAGHPEIRFGSEIGSAKQIVKPGDVMISKIVPHIRRSSVVGSESGLRQIASGEWIVFRSNKIFPSYLRHLLVSNEFHSKFMTTVSGIGGSLLRARPSEVARITIPIPPLSEQRRVAEILDKAEDLIAKRRKAIAKLDELLKSVFLDMFGDPAANPRGWPIRKIADLLESFTYGSSEKAALSGDVPILRMNNITTSGEMNLTDLKYLPADRVSDRHLVAAGDVLFNRTNSKELVGKTAVYDGPSTMAYAGYLVRARPKDAASAHYISGFLNSSYGKATLRGMCKSIVGMANINAKEFSAIEIAIPPIAVQREFASRVKAIRDYRRKLEAHQGVLDKLFGSLQQRAFAGDL